MNARNTRILTFCEPCYFAIKTPFKKKVWPSLFKTPYGEFPIANPSTDP
jgi:hypothetical protein